MSVFKRFFRQIPSGCFKAGLKPYIEDMRQPVSPRCTRSENSGCKPPAIALFVLLSFAGCTSTEPRENLGPGGVPVAPTGVTAVGGDGSATLSWEPSISDTGAAVITYTVTAEPGGRTCRVTNDALNQCVITGLTNGTSYTFTVTAASDAGTSPPSPSSYSVMPGNPDGIATPYDVSASAGAGQAYVTWWDPLSNRQIGVMAYKVVAVQDTTKKCESFYFAYCTVTGLASGSEYAFTVKAIGENGASAWSWPSNKVVPSQPHGDAPTNVVVASVTSNPALAGSGRAIVAWNASEDTEGFRVARYSVTTASTSQSCNTDGKETSCTVTGLVGGLPYWFVVRPVDSSGSAGTASLPSAVVVVPRTVPYKPAIQSLTYETGKIRVNWWRNPEIQINDLSYRVTMSPGSAACEVSKAAWGDNSCTLSELGNVADYRISLTAKNSLGETTSDTTVLVGGAVVWNDRKISSGPSLNSVAWSGTSLVAVGNSGRILTSADGLVWTSRGSGVADSLKSVVRAGNQFVAVGENGVILTSQDGVAWARRNSGSTFSLNAVCWTGELLVVAGNSGTVLTSKDGIVWSRRETGTTLDLRALEWTGQRIVAAGQDKIILTSENGSQWDIRLSSLVGSGELQSLRWAGDRVIAVGYAWVGSTCSHGGCVRNFSSEEWSSVDGLAWTKIPEATLSNVQYYAMDWAAGVYVLAGGQKVYMSRDGKNWSSRTIGGSAPILKSVVWAGNRIVAVGEDGPSNGLIMTSP